MIRRWLPMLACALAVAGPSAIVIARPGVESAQQAGSRVCLHNPDETPEDADRRVDAVRLARAINTAQSVAASTLKRYVAIEDLPSLPAAPDGFEVALNSDEQSYAFSLKDTLDPCRFVLFSDQHGLIYVGQPLQ